MASHEKTTARTLEPGEVLLGRYVVERQVAEGGMAAIHRTLDRRTHQKVAVKVLYPYYSQNPVVCTRFLDEGRIQRYLDHPNIINVYDIVDRPQLAIVMEYIDGPTLDEYLTDHGPLNAQELLSLMLPVLSAVGFAHHKGVIHRDIKPSNILLDPTPSGMVPKIMDFGVAKVVRGGKDLTAAGTTVGTLHYMSPEQIVGSRDIDGRADIYSLGVTIYKLCTGDVPFNASTEFALMMAQVEARPTPPSELRPDISPKLEQIILKALAKKPDQRYQTVKELTSALLELEVNDGGFDETDTDTAPLPAELLEYAMMADEVAIDRTGELDITQFEELLHNAETQKDRPSPAESEATIKLDADRLRERILSDKSFDDLSETTPHERVERKPGNARDKSSTSAEVDTKDHTVPFKRPDPSTFEPKSSLPADTSSDRRALSQETTRPFGNDDADPNPAPADGKMGKMDNKANTQDVTTPRLVKDTPSGPDKSGEYDLSPLRARASDNDSLTKRSRDEVREEFDRISKQDESSFSRGQLVVLAAGVLVVLALAAAIAWVVLIGH